MALSSTKVNQTKPKAKPFKLFDGDGLYLLIKPNGGRYWRMKYRFGGKEKLLALGVYPAVSLTQARSRRDRARELLADGIDPGEQKQSEKKAQQLARENSLEAVAREWIERQRNRWTARHAQRVLWSLEADVFPELGPRSIAEISAPDLLRVLRKVEHRGVHDTVARLLQRCSGVFRYGIAIGCCSSNPATELRGAFTPPKATHYAALSADQLPEFFIKLDAYEGHVQTRLAIWLLLYTFVRTVELRGAAWTEFDLRNSMWRIPAERMKTKNDHLVPLSRQALEILSQIHALSGRGRLVFPSERDVSKPMSENTILYALYRMGYHSRATGHGFRATASTILNEQGWRSDVIERQLAHVERNKVRAAYHRSEYLEERRKMMQAWADYLDSLTRGARIIPLRVNDLASSNGVTK